MEEENERFSEIEARVEAIEEVTISYLSSFRQELSDIKSSLETLEENTIQKTDNLETDVKSIKTKVSKLEDKITLPKSNQTKRILIDDELSPPPAKRLSLTPTTTSIGNVLSDDDDETPSTSKRLSLTSLKKTPTLTPSPSSHYSIPKTLADLSIPVQQKLQPFANVKIDYREKLSQAQYVFYSYMINKFDLGKYSFCKCLRLGKYNFCDCLRLGKYNFCNCLRLGKYIFVIV